MTEADAIASRLYATQGADRWLSRDQTAKLKAAADREAIRTRGARSRTHANGVISDPDGEPWGTWTLDVSPRNGCGAFRVSPYRTTESSPARAESNADALAAQREHVRAEIGRRVTAGELTAAQADTLLSAIN